MRRGSDPSRDVFCTHAIALTSTHPNLILVPCNPLMAVLLPLDEYGLVDRMLLVLSSIGLILGLALIFWGFTISYACPAQLVGQPPTCPEAPRWLILVGVAAVLLSLAGLFFSLRKPKLSSSSILLLALRAIQPQLIGIGRRSALRPP